MCQYFAFIIGVPMNNDINYVKQVSNNLIVEKFIPKSIEVSGTNEKIEMKD